MNDQYKFLIAGGSNTAITFAFYSGLVKAGLNYNAALCVVYPLGIMMGFLVNRWWTFAERLEDSYKAKSTQAQLIQYIAVYGLVFVVNLLCLNLFVVAFSLTPILAQLFALSIATFLSYVLQKFWVFTP